MSNDSKEKKGFNKKKSEKSNQVRRGFRCYKNNNRCIKSPKDCSQLTCVGYDDNGVCDARMHHIFLLNVNTSGHF